MLINKLMYGVSLLAEQRSSHTLQSHWNKPCSLQRVTLENLCALGIQQMYKVLTTINS